MHLLRRFTTVWVAFVIAASCLTGRPAVADVSVAFDIATLNALLPALTSNELQVPLSAGKSITVIVDRVRVTGLAPARTPDGVDQILSSLRLQVPSLGLELPVDAELNLAVVEGPDSSELELRFGRIALPLPLAGSINLAPFLAPFRFPANNLWRVEGVQGGVDVRSRLARIRMGQDVVRFEFTVDVADR